MPVRECTLTKVIVVADAVEDAEVEAAVAAGVVAATSVVVAKAAVKGVGVAALQLERTF